MRFFISGQPPRTTAQEKKVRVVHGRPMYYEPARVKEAKAQLTAGLMPHRPPEPFSGPISLEVTWCFDSGKSHHSGDWKVTRPDTDNLEKMLKDCMTDCGYWHDDAQVARETAEKIWCEEPGIWISVEVMDND